MIERMSAFANYMGWKLQPNLEVRRELLDRLQDREYTYGVPVCPCVFIDPNYAPHRAVILYDVCPCHVAYESVEMHGQCKCGLFVKGEDDG